MQSSATNSKNKSKKWWIILGTLFLAGVVVVWYLFTLKYEDTAVIKPDYSVSSEIFIQEFQQNDSLANLKYTEKIVEITGPVSDIEKVDTTANIKMTDSASGSYINFAFQSNDMTEIRKIKAGDIITIKGSCNGGMYSRILETHSITFKRCVISQLNSSTKK